MSKFLINNENLEMSNKREVWRFLIRVGFPIQRNVDEILVKPVYNDHPWDPKIVPFLTGGRCYKYCKWDSEVIQKWSLTVYLKWLRLILKNQSQYSSPWSLFFVWFIRKIVLGYQDSRISRLIFQVPFKQCTMTIV